MPPKLALLLAAGFVGFVFWTERKREAPVSSALFWPLLWYSVAASRPIGIWLHLWGIPLPDGTGDAAEGSIIDRCFYTGLTLIGLRILSRRGFQWSEFARANVWLVLLVAYLCLSIAWSDFPMVSFKRLIKVFGAIVIALVVLTEDYRIEAIAAMLRRCAYFHIPISIVLIRYFRDIGVSWDWNGGAVAWVGMATSKNTLGQIAMTSALCFIWERMRNPTRGLLRCVDYLYIAMSLYLLKGSDSAVSMTSLAVCTLGIVVFLILRRWEERPVLARRFFTVTCAGIVALLLLVVVHSVVNFSEHSFVGSVIKAIGRDTTLTGRTYIWHDMYDIAAKHALLGVGFGAFWIGRAANIPWNADMTWVLGQGHNGYIDAFLQIGWIGLALFAAWLFSVIRAAPQSFADDPDYSRFRMTFVAVVLFVNITESTFLRGDHNLWFVFLIAGLSVPTIASAEEEDGIVDAEIIDPQKEEAAAPV